MPTPAVRRPLSLSLAPFLALSTCSVLQRCQVPLQSSSLGAKTDLEIFLDSGTAEADITMELNEGNGVGAGTGGEGWCREGGGVLPGLGAGLQQAALTPCSGASTELQVVF